MRGVMVDLETMGTKPGAAIVSIGAVLFDSCKQSLEKEFYCPVSLKSCMRYGLTVEADTVEWWLRQSQEARMAIAGGNGLELDQALMEFAGVFRDQRELDLWGNGSDFDNMLLIAAYQRVGLPPPWGTFRNRCYRTIKSLCPEVQMARMGTHHNALDDAKSQAWHLMVLLNKMSNRIHMPP
jgi:hypothetical protein